MTQMKRVKIMFKGSRFKQHWRAHFQWWLDKNSLPWGLNWQSINQSNFTHATWRGLEVGFKQNCCRNANYRVMFLCNSASEVLYNYKS